jgi:hypothetical protein
MRDEREMIECDQCDEGYVDQHDGDLERCDVCDGMGEVAKPDPRLAGRSTCAVCGHRYSWGCGHTPDMESAFLEHCDTTEHLLGDCDCFVSRAGYAAHLSRGERRDGIAAILRELRRVMDATQGGTLTIDAGDELPRLMDVARC